MPRSEYCIIFILNKLFGKLKHSVVYIKYMLSIKILQKIVEQGIAESNSLHFEKFPFLFELKPDILPDITWKSSATQKRNQSHQ